MDEIVGIGLRDFQLYLVHILNEGPPAKVASALAALGADEDEAWRAYQQISHLTQMVDSETGMFNPVFSRLSGILGDAEEESTGLVHGVECRIRFYRLPLWPEYRYRIAGDVHGVIHDENFVRAPDAVAPILTSPGDLVPWEATKDEVEAAFGPLEEGEVWPPYGYYTFAHSDAAGRTRKVDVVFRSGLLELVSLPEDEPN